MGKLDLEKNSTQENSEVILSPQKKAEIEKHEIPQTDRVICPGWTMVKMDVRGGVERLRLFSFRVFVFLLLFLGPARALN